MLNAFARHHDRFVPADLATAAVLPLWVDLSDPTPAETELVALRLGLALPTRAAMDEIEPSSRLYVDGDAQVMTVTVAHGGRTTPVTFALTPTTLVTLRIGDRTPFGNFVHRPLAGGDAIGAEQVFLGLLDAIVDRVADQLEAVGETVDGLSREVFAPEATKAAAKTRGFEAILGQVGTQGDTLTRLRESLVGLNRLLGFHAANAASQRPARDARQRAKSLQRDVASLTDHAGFLASKINFLLDATLGLINLEQNQVVKIFTVAAVAFLPPTLIASIYGMNFDTMPELRWHLGYPFAIGLMVVSAVLPFIYFRRRGWL